jgi:hypothetical protein
MVREYEILKETTLRHLERRLPVDEAMTASQQVSSFLDEAIRVSAAEYAQLKAV